MKCVIRLCFDRIELVTGPVPLEWSWVELLLTAPKHLNFNKLVALFFKSRCKQGWLALNMF